jgi:site-specific DNA-methyltransferase (adenine-specific)
MSCTLIHGDCLEEMDKLIDEGVKVDLTVTSPPYDDLRTYQDEIDWNFNIFKEIANLLYGITKDGGVVVWIVNDATINGSETGTSFRQALYFKEIGFNLHDTMIYQKTGIPFPEQVRYYPCFEYMFVLSKGKPKTINLIQDKKNSGFGHLISGSERQADGSFKRQNGAIEKRRLKEFGVRTNVWVYKTGKGNSSKNPIAFEHPAIFPLNLAEDHILSWSNPNDIVLDCFMGSGTTGVACLQNNRNFIGIEKVKKYYNIAKERCKTYQSKLW